MIGGFYCFDSSTSVFVVLLLIDSSAALSTYEFSSFNSPIGTRQFCMWNGVAGEVIDLLLPRLFDELLELVFFVEAFRAAAD